MPPIKYLVYKHNPSMMPLSFCSIIFVQNLYICVVSTLKFTLTNFLIKNETHTSLKNKVHTSLKHKIVHTI